MSVMVHLGEWPALVRWGGWAAALLAVVVTVLYGPFVAGFVFVGIAFALIAVLAILQAVHAYTDWRLDHPWSRRSTRA
jgi:hypothetical protein